MKKFMSIAAALLMALSLAKPAHAECDGFYVGLRGGVASHDIEGGGYDDLDKEKLMLSGALGYRYEWFRTELEFVWRDYAKHTEYSSTGTFKYQQKLKSYSYMWNFYWDILPYHWLSPYVNVGIGLSKLKYHSDDISGLSRNSFDTTRLTWAAGGGFTVKLTNRWNIDLGYRYYDMGSLRNADIAVQEFYAGVRYIF